MNAETQAVRPARTASFAVVAVAAVVLLVMFVLPGFLAASFSRGHSIALLNNVAWMGQWGGGPEPKALRIEMGILIAPNYLMMHSKPIRYFYRWQYRLADGEEIHVPELTTDFNLPQD